MDDRGVERGRQMPWNLGLLVLTGLRPLEIFANKLLGAGPLAAYALLGGLPFFAIPFLAGGISTTQFLCALAFLGNGLLLCVAVGLFASVLHREGGQAQITAVGLTAILSLATPLMWWFSAAVWVWIMSGSMIRGLPIGIAAFFVLALSGAVLMSFGRRRALREKLARELRLIACASIPTRGDKRFRKWDPELVFPPGRWGEFQLFPAKRKKGWWK